MVVKLDDGASLDFDQVEGDVAFQHYAFLIDEDDFDSIFAPHSGARAPVLGRPRQETLRARSITTTAGAGFTSTARTAICWKSLRSRMQAVREAIND